MIELRELLKMLIGNRWLIGGVFSICLLASVVLLLTVTPMYRAQIHLQPPDPQQVVVRDERGIALAAIRLPHSSVAAEDADVPDAVAATPDYVFPYVDSTPAAVYHRFLENLRSRQLRYEYFEQAGLIDVYTRAGGPAGPGWSPERIFEEVFNPHLLVYWGGETFEEKFVRVSFDFEDPQTAADALNGFVAMVERRTAEQIVEAAALHLTGEISLIEAQILASGEQTSPLRDRLKLLSGISLTSDTFAAARIDQPAPAPWEPFFPRPATTLALGSLAGLFLGFALALALSSIRRTAGSAPVY